MELFDQTIWQLRKPLFDGSLSATELNAAVWKRIDAVEDRVLSYITLTREGSQSQTQRIEKTRARDHELLTGVPIALKDNLATVGVPTTCASRILATYTAPYNATVVDRLAAAGAVFTGKTNLDEFAMGSSTENSAMHVTHNPWNLECVPGGSSGGSAAAVAAGEAIAALGSDTGGSIRQPASFCGVVGLKPTYGRVSRYGLFAFASSLDQIGPITKDVTDCAIMLQSIAGHDPKDSTSADIPVGNYSACLTGEIKGLKFGVVKELLGEGIHPEVKAAVKKAVDLLTSLGGQAEEVSLPSFKYALPCYYLIAPSEASSNLARYDGAHYGFRDPEVQDLLTMYMETRRKGFGPEVKRRIMIGTHALSAGYYDAYYRKAQQVRTLIKKDFEKAFSRVDLLVTPTCPTVAFKIGEKTNDPLSMYLSDIATIPINLAGVPAISIPCGFADDLPIGLQLIGKLFGEETLLRAAYAYEQNTEWHKRRPTL